MDGDAIRTEVEALLAERETLQAKVLASRLRAEVEALRAEVAALSVPEGAVLRVENAGKFDGYYRQVGGQLNKPTFVHTSSPAYKIYYRLDQRICPGWRWCLSDHDHGGYDGRGFYNDDPDDNAAGPPERGWKEGNWDGFDRSRMRVIYGPF